MKRGGPLARSTPLTARKGLARTGLRRSATARLVASRRVYADARRVVFDRDRGRCVVCAAPATETHHRLPRGMGGSSRSGSVHSPANLCAMCRACHEWVELHRALACRYGYLLVRGDNCLTVPVLTVLRGWLVFDDGGGWTAAADPTAGPTSGGPA